SRRAASGRQLKSLAYCVDAVLEAAEEEKEAAAGTGPVAGIRKEADESFSRTELRAFFGRNIERVSAAVAPLHATQPELASHVADAGTRLTGLLTLVDAPGLLDLEDLERRLTVIEEKLTAALIGGAPEDFMLDVRREMDRQLAPYR